MESKIITGNLRNSEELKIRVFRFSPLVWTVSRKEADKQGDVIYFSNEVLNSWKSLADVVEEAISSIVKVGIRLSKSNEAKWLAEQLRTVQQFGKKFSAASQSRHPSEIGQMCAFLYTRERVSGTNLSIPYFVIQTGASQKRYFLMKHLAI
jgi:hypothetical protein